MKWAYGLTTVPQRMNDLLPRTLASLAAGGFDRPRIFIDDCHPEEVPRDLAGTYEVTTRHPRIRAWGNWWLALWELYIRNPAADRYAIFQDDLVCSRNLRKYLERLKFPDRGYQNLYTFPENAALAGGRVGQWYKSNQRGLGALALVFNHDCVSALLRSRHAFNKPRSADRGHKCIDGGVIDSMTQSAFHEYVHVPSLVQHTSQHHSSIGNPVQPLADTFRGEDYDLLELLSCAKVG